MTLKISCKIFAFKFFLKSTLFERFKCEFESENHGRSRGTLLNLQRFKGRMACWNSEMGTRTSDKRVNYSHKLALQVGLCMVFKGFLMVYRTLSSNEF